MAGNDTSEIFDIHEYKNGDFYNRIHWKLSAKSDSLFVKDYSFPLGNESLILIDIYKAKDNDQRFDIDGIFEFVYAIGSIACFRGKEVVVAFYDNKLGEMRSVPITSLDKLDEVLYELIALEGDDNTPTFDCYLDSDLQNIPRIIYVSSHINDKVFSYAELTTDKEITIFDITGDDNTFSPDSQRVFRINRDEILQELYRVII